MIKRKSKEHWNEFCNQHTTKLDSIWRMTKNMNGIKDSREMPSLELNNLSANTKVEKANLLAETFERLSSDKNYTDKFLEHKQRCEEDITFGEDTSKKDERNTETNQDFSLQELLTALNQTKKSSAPGPDNIKYEMIKKLPLSSLQVLLHIFNNIWNSGEIPKNWKHAEIIPFPKQGKSRIDPSNYRPISLTSVLGKCMEKIVNNRLTWFFGKK